MNIERQFLEVLRKEVRDIQAAIDAVVAERDVYRKALELIASGKESPSLPFLYLYQPVMIAREALAKGKVG